MWPEDIEQVKVDLSKHGVMVRKPQKGRIWATVYCEAMANLCAGKPAAFSIIALHAAAQSRLRGDLKITAAWRKRNNLSRHQVRHALAAMESAPELFEVERGHGKAAVVRLTKLGKKRLVP